MPPKGSGRGGTRGRGRARGGASAGPSGDAPANDSSTTEAPMGEATVSATIESQPGDGAGALSAAGAESARRAPVQRLESLKSTEAGTRSASPATRRSASTRSKKPAVVKPTFTGRRSRAEREALEKLMSQQEKERLAEGKAEGRARGFAARGDRGGKKTRGDYKGAVSGPFSMGSISRDRRPTDRITGSGSGSRATRIKREDYDDFEGGGRGGGSSSRGGGVKREDGGYISSGDDEDDSVPRKDIDEIEISSDEGEADVADSKHRAAPNRNAPMLLPVRIGRREHLDRVVGINTDASSEAAAALLKKAEAAGTEVKAEVDDVAPRKGKGKAKEVDLTGARRPYKGMWQDGDEQEIKTEPSSEGEDVDMLDAEPVGVPENSQLRPINLDGSPSDNLDGSPSEEEKKADAENQDLDKKSRARAKTGREPALQTEEEKAEYARFITNREAVRHELGPEEENEELRESATYVFQFPAKMPNARLTHIKAEPEPTQSLPPPMANGKQTAVVVVDDKPKQQSPSLHLTKGIIGKLRLRQSGRTTLTWGDETFDIAPGLRVEFLQEMLEVETSKRASGQAGTSLGRIRGSFVAKPDWMRMLEG